VSPADKTDRRAQFAGMPTFGVEQPCVAKPEIADQDRKVTCPVHKTGNDKRGPIDVKRRAQRVRAPRARGTPCQPRAGIASRLEL